MKNLLYKEMKLSTPLLTFLFLGFAVMTFIPGYPILCGAFFVCFGIFQSYQYSREADDLMYSLLLPVKKEDVVKAKYVSAFILQMMAFVLFAVCTLIRMSWLADAPVYVNNYLMAANPAFLGFVLMIFAVFNTVFIGGFFKTAYKFGKPFVAYVVICFVIIIIAESLHHFPGLDWLNAFDFSDSGALAHQAAFLIAATVIYILMTVLSCRKAQKRFVMIDM